MKHLAAAAMVQVLWLLLAIVEPSSLASAAANTKLALPDCPDKCGDVVIPYPFGIGARCAWQGTGNFTVFCNETYTPHRPYTMGAEIRNISLEAGQVSIFIPIDYIVDSCYVTRNTTKGSNGFLMVNLEEPFLISPKANIFTAIGCNTVAILDGGPQSGYYTGCMSNCQLGNDNVAADDEPCSGFGCCQTSLPANRKTIEMRWLYSDDDNANDYPDWEKSPCSYAFLSEKGSYTFKRMDINGTTNRKFVSRLNRTSLPLVLDWSVLNNGSCPSAGKKAPACVSSNSECFVPAVHRNSGYLCKCSSGYQGNPYISGGCTDINECEDPNTHNCSRNSKCRNNDGGYDCKCNTNWKKDDKKECVVYIVHPWAIAFVATFVSVVLAIVAIILLQKRRHRKLFKEHGGHILKRMEINIFTEEELKNFTNNYSNPIGEGNFGKVFKGTIQGAQTQLVAVKRTVEKREARRRQKTLRPEATQQEQESSWKDGFVDEITFQFKIKHPNVVRLVGCCLDTDVPVLVFEFVGKGSLEDVLHVRPIPLSLSRRLDIAIGSAAGLSHMHSENHVHGDVKPANILLDDELNPKVSDFGSSKLLSANRYASGVAADMKYIDPMYHSTGRFTVKSDVYSFGLVLLELITRKKARYGTGDGQTLATEFKKACKTHGNGRKMYDAEILMSDDNAHSHRYMECLDMVGALAVRCLIPDDPDERPKMADVVEELKQAKKLITSGSTEAS